MRVVDFRFHLHSPPATVIMAPPSDRLDQRGRFGFDVMVEAEVACRGCLVGLVKNPGKTLSADTELALAA